MTRTVIDPVTRIEGHLRIEAEINDGVLKKAWASGTMFRGIEMIVRNRDPRDAWYFIQRICSVCTAVHAIASVRAVENALGITISENGLLIRNLIGGMATAINPDSDQALNASRILMLKETLQEAQDFVEKVYFPDVLAIASFYPEWTKLGEGLGNFLACGDFPAAGKSGEPFMPGGVVWDRKIGDVKDFDHLKVTEYVTRSWYTYPDCSGKAKHPFDGETNPKYDGPKLPYDFLDVDEKYSWIKSPRYEDKPVEVGPLARVLVAYGKGHKQIRELVDNGTRQLGVGNEALFSTLGRTLARAVETVSVADEMWAWYDKFVANVSAGDYITANMEKWEPKTWPAEAQGVGLVEAPRGALGHWVKIKNGKIDQYQIVVSTT